MVDFRSFPPMNHDKRKEAVEHGVKRLLNGAKFKFVAWTQDGKILGQYLDYAGEWTTCVWNNKGEISNREFAEMDLDWGSAR